MIVAANLAAVFTPITGIQCPNVANSFLIPMRLFFSPKSTAVLRKNSTGGLIPTSGRWFMTVHCFAYFFAAYFYFVLNLT